MDIPNLSHTPTVTKTTSVKPLIILLIVILAVSAGFGLSRFFSTSGSQQNSLQTNSNEDKNILDPESIKSKNDIVAGQSYGNVNQVFKDKATGTIEVGSVNGEGTHILNREGGVSQRAALTSSVLDLDLFVGRKVEVKGETNASKKASWLMDVGSIKVLE